MPLDENIKLLLNANPGATVEEAQEGAAILSGAQGQQVRPPPGRMVTSGEVLAEQHRPLTEAVNALMSEGGQGLGEAADVFNNPLGGMLGVLKMGLAPSVAAGAAVGTTAQNMLANIPGLGGASGAVPAAGAAGADLATQLLTGPGALKFEAGFGKAAVRGLGKAIMPGELREAGVEVAAGKLGRPKELIERVLTTPASKALFKGLGQAENVPIRPIYDLVDSALQKEMASNLPESSTINVLNKLKGNLQVSLENPNITQTYEALADTTQRLGGTARSLMERKPNTAANIYELRAQLLDKMDEISPRIKQVNSVYRKEMATDDVLLSLRNSDPGAQFKRLLESDRSIAQAFKDNPKMLRDLQDIAEEMSTVASTVPAGGWRQMVSIITEAPRTMFTNAGGRALLRNALEPVSAAGGSLSKSYPQASKVNPTRVFAAVQLWKAKEGASKVIESMKSPNVPIEQKIAAAQMQDQLEKQLQQTLEENK